MVPTKISGDSPGKIEGRKIVFSSVDVNPKEKRSYRIRARAIQQGDSRLKVYMNSELIKTKVTEKESTHIY